MYINVHAERLGVGKSTSMCSVYPHIEISSDHKLHPGRITHIMPKVKSLAYILNFLDLLRREVW
jgi:hypothetical protein